MWGVSIRILDNIFRVFFFPAPVQKVRKSKLTLQLFRVFNV